MTSSVAITGGLDSLYSGRMTTLRSAAVVGAGPNGLTAAAVLARAGLRVEVFEAGPAPGGAARSVRFYDRTIDLGAAAHPFGVASPAFRALGLEDHGLEWAHPRYPLAHPFDDDPAALLHRDLNATARGLGVDGPAWRALHAPIAQLSDAHLANVLRPLTGVPPHPLAMARFGVRAALPASAQARALFRTEAARALFIGSALHALCSPTLPFTSAFGVLFGALGMTTGWPVARGGSGAITDALASVLATHGGVIHTAHPVTDMRELTRFDAVVLALTPRQVLGLRNLVVPERRARVLRDWRYGPGAFKIDYALDGPVPWRDPAVGEAGTVHLGGTVPDLIAAERAIARGEMPARPVVLVAQQSAADPGRGHTLWAYAHVPHGFTGSALEHIEGQLERFAPGFTAHVLARRVMSPTDLETWNPNLVGGDIAGGAMTGTQLFLRPGFVRNPYQLTQRVFLASAATAPGGGVHGMPGWHAAHAVLHSA